MCTALSRDRALLFTSHIAPRPIDRIEVDALTCTRGGRAVLEELSFAVERGTALVLRGPNGSGKTTLLRAMAGLLPPVSGRIAFQQAGAALAPRDAHEALHYIAHANAVKPRLTLLENVVFWQRFYGGRGDEAQAEAALEAFALLPFAPFPAAHLSQGQTRRLGLCRLLAASRPVWLLDEPTAALDATSARLLERQIDRHLVNGGLAVIATHLDLTLAQQASLDLATAPAQEPQRAAVL